ncbi:histidinol-phosphatase [Amylibacter sp. IMCC11727]|uniref:histidinol-phosphatase n=1 Tax=Amylibacter sp. IMCC11727 TaxID=3039851 RepID=UPI00244E4D66|nr:histidinol-phosphatase [Amylibacter sp. IMCC11727]WGI23037.1 histidinol-phosphatase [Amylibacter sp. IMCC11727]
MTQNAPLSQDLQTELLSVAHAMADAARPIAMQYFRADGQGIENKLKGDFDPVTVADRAIERAMRDILAARRPDDAILGEEYGQSEGSSGLTWVLDPIDGTRGYISGTPTWGVLIAVGGAAGPQIGMIDQPFIQERFVGAPEGASWHFREQIRPLAVRSCADLASAILFTTFPEVGTQSERDAFERVRDCVQLTRYGTDCYAYGLVAAGQVDLVIEAGLNAYDIQGPMAVVEAAGGIVTDWEGGPVHEGGRVIAAGDALMHAAALELLKGCD